MDIQLIYFIVSKASSPPTNPIVPNAIVTDGTYYKLLPKKHVIERDTYMAGSETLNKGHEDYDADKKRLSKVLDDRFSRPKLPSQFQKPTKSFNTMKPEKGLYSRKFDREESQTSEFLGKRLQQHFLEPTRAENDNPDVDFPFSTESFSSIKLLKETAGRAYDKILNDITLQTSKRTNQDLGAWPLRSEEEKQSKNINLLNFLSKNKIRTHEPDEVKDTLKERFMNSKLIESMKPTGIESILSKERRLYDHDLLSGEYRERERRESTLSKAISAIRSSKFKTGVDHYGSPKLHEQHTTFPPGF